MAQPPSSPDDDLVRELVLRAATGTLDALSILTAEHDAGGEVVDFRMRFTNDAATAVTGFTGEDSVGRTISELFPQRAAWLVALWTSALRSGEPLVEEIELRRPGAPTLWMRQQIVPLGDAVAITSHDITSRKVAEQELRHRATHDPLTELPNRTLAEDRISRSVTHGDTLVVFADLDRFKAINDQLGHVAGDELLVQAARRLRSCLRADDLVARFGGDEFLVCIGGPATPEDAAPLAGKLLDAMRYPFHLDGRSVSTTVSIGIAHGRAGDDPAELIRRADVAAYRAKRSGRNTWAFFDDEASRLLRERNQDDDALTSAITSGACTHAVVPATRLLDGALHSLCLVPTWPHGDGGHHDAVRYLAGSPHPERVAAIDRTTARLAPDVAAALASSADTDVPIRVPLYSEVPDVDVVLQLGRSLAELGLPAGGVAVDLQPTALRDEHRPLRAALAELSSIGIGLVVRGFGDAEHWRTDTDGLALRAVELDPRSAPATIAASVAWADHLGVDTVAAGVVDVADVASLRGLGVTAVSGPAAPVATGWGDHDRSGWGRDGSR